MVLYLNYENKTSLNQMANAGPSSQITALGVPNLQIILKYRASAIVCAFSLAIGIASTQLVYSQVHTKICLNPKSEHGILFISFHSCHNSSIQWYSRVMYLRSFFLRFHTLTFHTTCHILSYNSKHCWKVIFSS